VAARGEQVEAVRRLVRESVASVDALAPEAMRAVMPALLAARDEMRADLLTWLKNAPDGKERFTAFQKKQALRALESSLDRVGELEPAMGQALAKSRKLTGPLAVKNLETEIARLSSIFDGGIPTMPQIDVAAVLAQGQKLLWRRHETSARRYADAVGDDIRNQFAIGVAKGETFEQLVTRLRRLNDPAAKKRGIDPGADAAGIADGLFRRDKHMADRLVRTEMMHAYNVQHDEAIKQADERRPEGDDEYLRKWDATADTRLCPLCREFDGTVARIDGAFAGGIKTPPRHPYCRCTVLAWMARWGDMKGEVPVKGPLPEPRKKERTGEAPKPKPEAKRKTKAEAEKEPKPGHQAETKRKPVKRPPPPPPPKPKREAKPPPPPKPPKPAPAPVETRPASPMDPDGQRALEAMRRGDRDGVRQAIEDAARRRGLVQSDVANKTFIVSDDGMAKVISHSGNEIAADGIRYWDGGIQISRATAAQAEAFAKVADTRNIEGQVAALDARINALASQRSKLAISRKNQAERDRLLAETDAAYGERADLIAAHRSAGGMRVLVHEHMHGFSPVTPKAYRHMGGQVEEVTTEVMARVMMRDLFGHDIGRTGHGGAYGTEIDATVAAIGKLTGLTPDESYRHLEAAAERFKRIEHKAVHPDQLVNWFSDELGQVIGQPTHDVHRVLSEHLKHAADQVAGQ